MARTKLLLLLLLTPLLLASCRSTYPSRKQAITACNKWKEKGGERTYKIAVKKSVIDRQKGNNGKIIQPSRAEKCSNSKDPLCGYQDGTDGLIVFHYKTIEEVIEKKKLIRSCKEETITKQFLGEEWVEEGVLKVKANFRY